MLLQSLYITTPYPGGFIESEDKFLSILNRNDKKLVKKNSYEELVRNAIYKPPGYIIYEKHISKDIILQIRKCGFSSEYFKFDSSSDIKNIKRETVNAENEQICDENSPNNAKASHENTSGSLVPTDVLEWDRTVNKRKAAVNNILIRSEKRGSRSRTNSIHTKSESRKSSIVRRNTSDSLSKSKEDIEDNTKKVVPGNGRRRRRKKSTVDNMENNVNDSNLNESNTNENIGNKDNHEILDNEYLILYIKVLSI